LAKDVFLNDYVAQYKLYPLHDKVTFADLKEYAETWYKEAKIDMLVQGNILESKVKDILKKGLSTLVEKPIDKSLLIERRCRELPVGVNYLKVRTLLPDDRNSKVENYYQIEPFSYEIFSRLFILTYLLKEPLFDQLRTQQQLGYSVGITPTGLNDYFAISISVKSQENLNSAKYVDEKIEEFVQISVDEILKGTTEEEFDTLKKSFIKLVSKKDNDLLKETKINWNEINEEEYVFDRRQKLANVLADVTKDQVYEFYQQYLRKPNQKKLSIQIVGYGDDVSNIIPGSTKEDSVDLQILLDPVEGGNVIDDIEKFKDSLVLHPVIFKN
jgi:nardilysin